MAVKSKDEILESIKSKLQEDSSDEALSLLEDVSDTMDAYEAQVKDSTDWKAEAQRIDADWRQKYKERFFSGPTEDDKVIEESFEEKKLTYEELFKEE